MNTTELLTVLREVLFDHVSEDVRTLQDAGYLTSDDGLTIRLPNGAEFLLTVQPTI